MSDIANRLRDQRLNLVNEMRAMVDKATEEGRDFDGQESGRYQAINEQIDRLDQRIQGVLDQETRAKEQDDAFNALAGKSSKSGSESRGVGTEQGTDEIRAFMTGKGSRSLWIPSMPAPQRRDGRWAFGEEQRADQTTSNAAGVIPTGFRAQLWEYMIEESGVLQAGVDLLETAGGETIKLPRATAHSAAGSTTEATAITASDPTLSSVNSTVVKEGYTTQFSTELLQDSGVDLNGYLARSAGRALGNAVGAAAVTAAVAAASAGVTAGNAIGAVTSFGTQSTEGEGFDFLIALYHSVIAPYRRRSSCAWLMSDTTAGTVRRLKSADGVYAWQPSVQVGEPDTILGKPVHIDTNVADPAASAESILFGDWSSLTVRIAGGFRFERSDDFAFDADLVTYRALVRHGSVSKDANALKSFTHAAS
jgi:HK97 family phage major capsid protein